MILDVFNKRQIVITTALLSAILLYMVHPLFSIIALSFSIYKTNGPARFELCGFILLISMVLYASVGAYTKHVTLTNILWCTLPALLSFILGRKIGGYFNGYSLLALLFVVFFGLALPHIVVTMIDVIENGLVNPERSLMFLGDREEQRAVTGRTMELSWAIGGFAMYFIKNGGEAQKIAKRFVILAVVAELCPLHYLSRTGIALLVIAIITGIIMQGGMSRKTLFLFLLIIVGYFLLSDSQLFDLFREREQVGSNIADAGGRTDRWGVGVAMLVSNPMGYTIEGFYAHNFWLDYGRDGGLYAAVLLFTFSVVVLFKSIALSKNSHILPCVRYCIVVSAIVAFAAMFTEPVHVGAPIFMHMYFLFSGIVVSLSRK